MKELLNLPGNYLRQHADRIFGLEFFRNNFNTFVTGEISFSDI